MARTRAPSGALDDARIINQWLHGKSPRTVEAYRADIAQALDFLRRQKRATSLAQIDLDDLQAYDRWLDSPRATPGGAYAPSSRRRKLNALKSLLRFAHQQQHLARNPALGLASPRAENITAERVLSEEQVRRILRTARDRGPRDHLIIMMLYGMGLRVSELTSLTWGALRNRMCTFRGKGGKLRDVPVPGAVWQQLSARRPPDAAADAPLFEGAPGQPLTRRQVGRIVKRCARDVDPRVSPHWLRHAHASHTLKRGVSIYEVQQNLGHASITTTERYLHLQQESAPGDLLLYD